MLSGSYQSPSKENNSRSVSSSTRGISVTSTPTDPAYDLPHWPLNPGDVGPNPAMPIPNTSIPLIALPLSGGPAPNSNDAASSPTMSIADTSPPLLFLPLLGGLSLPSDMDDAISSPVTFTVVMSIPNTFPLLLSLS